MQDVRQSKMYGDYMQKIGWQVETIDDTLIFVKRFPLIGSFIKIQRPDHIPTETSIKDLVKKHRAWRVSLEMMKDERLMINDFKINNSPYLPTKTIQIDLTASEEKIFSRFEETKRRAVRRAEKNGVIIKESKNIDDFIKLKTKNFWPLSHFYAKDIKALYESFYPKNASILIAYKEDSGQARMTVIAGVLLLFHEKVAYYWLAAGTKEGKKLFAPTLLVLEALKVSKKKNCTVFDFEGIYDERFHNATKQWKGFTKFKQGFGGKEIIFPNPLLLRRAF
jgi:lipid II:glycine glycyltransferase (peptidoglycan interpeptide bridge formation enzyme)